MMTFRSVLLATALLAATTLAAFAENGDDAITAPVLRANVTVADDVVRIGDVIDNAGTAAQIAIYRAPDLGTTGSLPTAQVLTALQAHQVGGGLQHLVGGRDHLRVHLVGALRGDQSCNFRHRVDVRLLEITLL